MYSEDPVPTYEESVHSYSTAITTSTPADAKPAVASTLSLADPSSAGAPSLNEQLVAARSARISELLAQHIDPSLHASASAGLAQTTLVLIPTPPSTASTGADADASGDSDELLAPAAATEEVVGLPADAHPQLVRLRDPAHAERFWRQPAAVRALEAGLAARLAAAGHRVYAPQEVAVEAPAPVVAPPKRKGSWFGPRKGGAKDAPAGGEGAAGAPERRVELRDRPLEPGEVKVAVALRDVAVRAETGMGLYETRSGKAVVVGVEVG